MTENQQQTREQTPEEQFRMLFDRTAKLNDAVSALLAPRWGSENGIIPSDHPLYVGEEAAGEEQAAPVDWQAIVRDRERELKKVGEARHRAETAVRELTATLTEIIARFEPAFPSPKEPMRQQATVSIEDHQRWQNALESKESQ
ncbi:hypothetical protein ACWDBO_31330 [Streptomyces mirabilis]|uniref:hypothetical protein n=1 Tax=Streptomyces mirabilis TaxID=68239 RepID=UPI0033348DA6